MVELRNNHTYLYTGEGSEMYRPAFSSPHAGSFVVYKTESFFRGYKGRRVVAVMYDGRTFLVLADDLVDELEEYRMKPPEEEEGW